MIPILGITILLFVNSFAFAAEAEKAESSTVIETLENYAAAMLSMSIPRMEMTVDTSEEFKIFEGSSSNWGWHDFRDNHLAPEFKEILVLEYGFTEIKPYVDGNMAYATFKFKAAFKTTDGLNPAGEGLGTAVLLKQNGSWRIRHLHTSVVKKWDSKSRK